MYLPSTPESWVSIHLLSITLAIFSRVAMCSIMRCFVLSLLLVGVAMLCLMAAAAFWTQHGHATLSCMTLGIVLVATVFDGRPSACHEELVRVAMADEKC